MAEFTAADVGKLREMTGAGMVDCKKALDEAGGDLNAAVEIMRKKCIAKSAKRADRETSEGIVSVAVNADATEGYAIEVDSETDFVARSDKFQEFVLYQSASVLCGLHKGPIREKLRRQEKSSTQRASPASIQLLSKRARARRIQLL